MVLGYTNDFVVKMNTFIRCNVFNKPKDFQNGDYVVCKSSALDVFSDSYSRTKIESILKIIKIEGKGDIRKITFNNGNTYFAYLDSNLYRNQLQIIGKDCATKKNFKEYFNFVNRNLEIRDIFVCTTHSSQGSTYNNVVVYLDNLKKCFDYDLLRRMMYVAFSRAKEKIYILVN